MKKKRHGGMLEENKNKNIPASPDTNKKSDVSDIKGLKKQTKGISNIFNLLGKQYVKVMAFVLLGIIKESYNNNRKSNNASYALHIRTY